MKRKYGRIGNVPVFFMNKATKSLNKKGYVVVQSLINGDTATVKKTSIKSVGYKYPKLK